MGLQLVLRQGAIAMAAMAWVGCAPQPHGPEISIAPDGQAIVNVTRVSFQAIVLSLGGQPSYHWDFGNGEKGSGKVVEHVYRMEGRLPVTLTVESSHGTETARARVEVRALSGYWHSQDQSGPIGGGFGFNLTQAAGTLSGRVTNFSSCPDPSTPGRIEGTVAHPRTIRWTLTCGTPSQWAGEAFPDLDAIVLRREGSSPTDPPRIYYRTGGAAPAPEPEQP